jgi:hypothetical protein
MKILIIYDGKDIWELSEMILGQQGPGVGAGVRYRKYLLLWHI